MSDTSPPETGSCAEELINRFSRHDRRMDRRKKKRYFAPIGSDQSKRRLSELERIFAYQYGAVLPDDDAGRDDLHVILSVAKAAGVELTGVVRKLAPWMSVDETRRACGNADLATAYLKADAMADRIGLVYAVRMLLKVRTIGSIALVAGVYDGEVSVKSILQHGDFGLGTFANLDGEMVVLDGRLGRSPTQKQSRDPPAGARETGCDIHRISGLQKRRTVSRK